jgi:hypothetical protein
MHRVHAGMRISKESLVPATGIRGYNSDNVHGGVRAIKWDDRGADIVLAYVVLSWAWPVADWERIARQGKYYRQLNLRFFVGKCRTSSTSSNTIPWGLRRPCAPRTAPGSGRCARSSRVCEGVGGDGDSPTPVCGRLPSTCHCVPSYLAARCSLSKYWNAESSAVDLRQYRST